MLEFSVALRAAHKRSQCGSHAWQVHFRGLARLRLHFAPWRATMPVRTWAPQRARRPSRPRSAAPSRAPASRGDCGASAGCSRSRLSRGAIDIIIIPPRPRRAAHRLPTAAVSIRLQPRARVLQNIGCVWRRARCPRCCVTSRTRRAAGPRCAARSPPPGEFDLMPQDHPCNGCVFRARRWGTTQPPCYCDEPCATRRGHPARATSSRSRWPRRSATFLYSAATTPWAGRRCASGATSDSRRGTARWCRRRAHPAPRWPRTTC